LKSFLGINASKALGLNTNSNGPKGWSTPSSASDSNVSGAKSLQQIMSEELTQKKTAEEVSPNVRNQPHSWASKASKLSGTNPVVHTVPTVLSRPAIPPAPVVTIPTQASSSTPPPLNSHQSSGSAVRSTSSNQLPANRAGSKSDFGGKAMSPDMSEWCSVQLRKLNISEDSSGVLDFCMSLKSAVEIRETLSTYLGSSAQITNFATEFIRYKEEGMRPTSELSSATSDPKRSTSQFNTAAASSSQQKRKSGK